MMLTFREVRGLTSWGRTVRQPQRVAHPRFRDEIVAWGAAAGREPRLAIGLRRSYGDSGLSRTAGLIDMRSLDRILGFDPKTGLLRAEAGLSLDAMMQLLAPKGFFPATCPGTRFVTLGGAVANDVHGKNHHRAGAFGCAVEQLTLLRSDQGLVETSASKEPELFAATIGGMGLTGIILEVTLRLSPIPSTFLEVETLPIGDLHDFFVLSRDSSARFEHTVAWVDCTAGGARTGRGLFQRASWSTNAGFRPHGHGRLRMPLDGPGFVLKPPTLRAFNAIYRMSQLAKSSPREEHYAAFLHPLDSIRDWNRLYGSSGFFQYQCVTPLDAEDAVADVLGIVARSGQGSFLAVLKAFGAKASPGLMSFPRPGYTLALDFRNLGRGTHALFAQLDEVVLRAGGRLYPAKDGRMPPAMLEAGFPQLPKFRKLIDPACRSDFWDRMTGTGP